MKNRRKQKRRLGRTISRRRKEVYHERLTEAWRNIFVKVGVLKK